MKKKLVKIIDVIGLGAYFALIGIILLVVWAMVMSKVEDAFPLLHTLWWIIMSAAWILLIIRSTRFYKIDKTFFYSVSIAILFLAGAFLLWIYVFPSLVEWILTLD